MPVNHRDNTDGRPEPAERGSGVGESFRLGVIGGNSFVARQAIYPAVSQSDRVEIVAAASESGLPEEVSGVGRPSYQAVIDAPEVEAVYIPLPNSLHRQWAERAADSGKHVLCEKPIATNVADAAAMFAAANRAGVLLAEAYATPFHPRSVAVRDAVMTGSIGAVRSITSEFTVAITSGRAANHRWLSNQGGGALWDVGIYTISPILDTLPDASVVNVMSTTANSDVDSTTIVDFATPTSTGQAICSFELPDRQRLVFRGTDGTLTVDSAFTPGPEDSPFTIQRPTGSFEQVEAAAADPYVVMLETFAAACRGEANWPRDQSDALTMVGHLAEIAAMQPRRATDSQPGATT